MARFRSTVGTVLDFTFDSSKGRVCGKVYGESFKENAAGVDQERTCRPSRKIAGSLGCMLGIWNTLLYVVDSIAAR